MEESMRNALKKGNYSTYFSKQMITVGKNINRDVGEVKRDSIKERDIVHLYPYDVGLKNPPIEDILDLRDYCNKENIPYNEDTESIERTKETLKILISKMENSLERLNKLEEENRK